MTKSNTDKRKIYDQIRLAYDNINKLLASGHTKEDIIHQIAGENANEQELQHAIDLVESAIKYKKNWFAKIPFLIIIIIFFVVTNMFVYYGQELYYKDNTIKCSAMKQELQQKKKNIHSLENKLHTQIYTKDDYQKKSILGKTLQYDWQITNYYHEKYPSEVKNYNMLVNEYNQLAKETYTRWLIFPKPIISNKYIPIKTYKVNDDLMED